jgi:hypothetical protein
MPIYLRGCVLLIGLLAGCNAGHGFSAYDQETGVSYEGTLKKDKTTRQWTVQATTGGRQRTTLTGRLDPTTGTGTFRLPDGRELPAEWTGHPDQGGGRAGETLFFASGNPWYRQAFLSNFTSAPRGVRQNVADSTHSDPTERAVERIQEDWYFHTGSPRTRSEGLFRQWSEGVATAAMSAKTPRSADASLLTFDAVRAMEPLEQRLRAAMAADGHDPKVIDRFLAIEKTKMSEGLRRALADAGR